MTSEIVLMNRRAVALAADSAATITRWVRGEQKKRYFKGTNKLFHLSGTNPVGLLINGSASLQGVPWDVLVKSFRDSTSGKGFDTLEEYAGALFTWIENNSDAYPEDFLKRQFLSEVLGAAGRISFPGLRAMAEEDDKTKKREILTKEVQDQIRKVDEAGFLANAIEQDVQRALGLHRATAEKALQDHPFFGVASQAVGSDTFAQASISAVFKTGYSTLDETGVIVAGYGQREYFPKVEAHNCYGNMLGKLIYEREESNCRKIDQENTSELVPFAKSDMIYTFMFGASIRGILEIDRLHIEALDGFENRLREGGLLDDATDLASIKNEVHQEFKERTTDYFRTNHMGSLRDVVGMLPVEELAELSETLVLIESIKERVTTDEESVSGPVDVAVITRNDGFVWIKRKHYFRPDRNPRYFARLRDLIRGAE